MSDTPTPTPAPQELHPAIQALDRIGGYTLTFSVVFAAMVWASVLFLLPQFSYVEVLGARHTVDELSSLKADLVGKVSALEGRRTELVAPLQHAAYEELKDDQHAWKILFAWKEAMRIVAETSGKDAAVHLAEQSLNASARSITLAGDIRNSGIQSMTVLAGFIDALSKIPGASLTPVPFTRKTDARIGEYSPFTVTITLPQ